MKVTQEQLEGLKMVALCKDYKQARALCAELKLDNSATFTTEQEMKVALRAKAAMYNPADYAIANKLAEVEYNMRIALTAGRPIKWSACHARTPSKADARLKAGGKWYTLEIKTSAGDYCIIPTADKVQGMAYIAAQNKYLLWATEDFTIFGKVADILRALDEYPKGAGSFFKTQKRNGVYKLQLQEYKTSKRKLVFLSELENRFPIPEEVANRIEW